MKNLTEHIDEFERLMPRKGFDGFFLTNSNFPGKLKESLNQYMQGVVNKPAQPFYLTTYSLWNGEEKPHIIADFKMDYDKELGFRVIKLDAKLIHGSSINPARTIEVLLKDSEDMPPREDVNAALRSTRIKGIKI